MLKVGLTGGICSGKSTVGAMFVSLGCRLIDSDQITHELFEVGGEVYQAVVGEFGNRIQDDKGRIDRSLLGQIVFNDSISRRRLNELVHPAVIKRQKEFLESVATEDSSSIAIVDAALMIEVGTYKNFDRIIVVTCDRTQQIKRLYERSALKEKEIEARIASQLPLKEKVSYADFVIDNSSTLRQTRLQVGKVYEKLKKQSTME